MTIYGKYNIWYTTQLITLIFVCFRYAIMRSCWHEDPNKRLTFRQLHRAINQLDNEIQVKFAKMCA